MAPLGMAPHTDARATADPLDALVGHSAAMQEVFRLIEQVAATTLTVMVTGETGTGKELVARAVHGLSDRSRGPFIAVNGSAIPAGLIESEFFGHARGAFTGAVTARRGLMEEARGGTLFIDEISTLDLALQAKLLRALEDRRARPLGSNQSVPVDFRLIVATNEDLTAKVARGEFREDLYYRLNVFPLAVPPLRDRREDIPELADHFRRAFARSTGVVPPPLSDVFLERIQQLPWPGNVRELEHFVQRAIVLRLHGPDVRCVKPLDCSPRQPALLDSATADAWTLQHLEREYIHSVLQRTGGNRSEAAAILGIDRRTLHRKLTRETSCSCGVGPAESGDLP